LEDEDAGDFDIPVFEAAALVAAVGFGRAGTPLLAGRFAVRDDLPADFADFGFGLLVAIWRSLGQRQHHVLPLTRPRQTEGEASGRREPVASRATGA
jgi:hypothetical protein